MPLFRAKRHSPADGAECSWQAKEAAQSAMACWVLRLAPQREQAVRGPGMLQRGDDDVPRMPLEV
jgi:hypothetical protein